MVVAQLFEKVLAWRYQYRGDNCLAGENPPGQPRTIGGVIGQQELFCKEPLPACVDGGFS